MAITEAGPGARGGFKPTLTTVDLMKDKGKQATLPEGFRAGVQSARANKQDAGVPEMRNYRRGRRD